MGRGRCRLGFLPSERQPEGPNYRSSSWSVKRRVCVCVGGYSGASLARAATELSTTPSAKRAWWSQPDGIEGGREVGEWLSGGGCGGGSRGGRGNFKHVSPMFTFHGFLVFQIPLSMTDCPLASPLPTCKLSYGGVFACRSTHQRASPCLKNATLSTLC